MARTIAFIRKYEGKGKGKGKAHPVDGHEGPAGGGLIMVLEVYSFSVCLT